MVGFGRKMGWYAVLDRDVDAVRSAFSLRDLGVVDWRAGTDLAYLTEDRVFLTPPLPGQRGSWTLVAGWWLMRNADRFPVARLSTGLGTEVQRFSSHRVIEQHEWERAVDGMLVRAFGYHGESGELMHWIGDPDPAERERGLPDKVDEDDLLLVDESDVMHVAGVWSVDPSTLDGRPAPGPLHAAAPV